MAITLSLPLDPTRAQNRGGTRWDDDIRRRAVLPGYRRPVDGLAVIGAVCDDAGDVALRLPQQVRRLRRIVGMSGTTA